MCLADSLGNARILDEWRAEIGLVYPFEADDANIPTVSGEPLTVATPRPGSATPPMKYDTLPGLDKTMSRLVMGCDNQPDLAHASAIFDHFYSLGGNAFDTGYVYGGGRYERLFGQWMANRGVREDVVVIVKGAHTPHCDPDSLVSQLSESLERQQSEYADIYMMHRDNPDIPVGEFVDVLDQQQRAGRIKVIGVSNWTRERFEEANAYARANGKQGLVVLSNHFGLAEAYDVPWTGCRHVTDAASKQWLTQAQIPLLPWSSQARGFFARPAKPNDLSDPELVRCYYSDDNFERLRRAEKLGSELGVPATAIALAFVLCQPFPTFPLFGPRSIAETRSSMQGLGVELTEEQAAWLDLKH
jgi:aryl-alcohol dehydrogenase-like predicted oxidoreductase